MIDLFVVAVFLEMADYHKGKIVIFRPDLDIREKFSFVSKTLQALGFTTFCVPQVVYSYPS